MSTQTKYFCDKCNAESDRKLPAYSLRYDDGQTHNVHCGKALELCVACRKSLLDTIVTWGLHAYPRS